jgi:peptidoglycan/LPS O-acetylase OafA/YrhL
MDQQYLNESGMVARESIPSSDTVRVRFGEIDGLRAIAIIVALVYEAARIASPSANWPPILVRAFDNAGQSLAFFFVLSGFVLAYPAFATQREDGQSYLDIGRFLVKRALRIYPAYLVVLGLTFVVPPLALQYGLPALASGAASGLGWSAFFQNAFFVGSGLDNDGFRVLALEARWFLLFPALLLLWTRFPKIFLGVALFATLGDLCFGFLHATGIGALVPFMLGIVAADVRAGHLRIERYAFAITGVAALAAIVVQPFLALLPAFNAAPGALRVDPLWCIAFFGLVIAAGTSGIVERVLSLRPLRFLGAASFGIALVMVPVSGFIVRQVLSTFGQAGAAVNAAIFSALAGIVIWQLADRWFGEGNLRAEVANVAGPWLDAVLRLARIDRVVIGSEPELAPYSAEHEQVDPSFYAPPPRSESGDLASVSTRSGSAEDLAAEIMDMKKRLSDRSSAIFAESDEPEPEPVAVEPEPYERPGFYRRSADAAARTTTAPPDAPPPSPQQRPQPAPPRPEPKRAAAPPAYVEPQPISISFEPPAAPAAAAYQHFSLEPVAAAAPAPMQPAPAGPVAAPDRRLQPAPVAPPPGPSQRGPIKMRIGARPEPAKPTPGANGHAAPILGAPLSKNGQRNGG